MSADYDRLLDEELQLEEELALERARESLLGFITYVSPHLHISWHHRLICQELDRLVSGENKRLIVTLPPRHGKDIADDTPVWTTVGWKQHGDLQEGDWVYHPSGRPTRVEGVSGPLVADHVVTFTNGERIVCSGTHLWTVMDRRKGAGWVTLRTSDMMAQGVWLGTRGQRGGRAIYALPHTRPLEGEEVALPLDPYVLGAWLGDGTAASPQITYSANDAEVVNAVQSAGYMITRNWAHATTGVMSAFFGAPAASVAYRNVPCSLLWRHLIDAGVARNKHIPTCYLQASIRQRLQLLAGLIDTDGHVCQRTGRIRFINTNKRLVEGVATLARTLGARTYVVAADPPPSARRIRGKRVCYQVCFNLPLALPCRLSRKQNNMPGLRRRVAIASIEKHPPKPSHCIKVESADGLYLVGEQMVPTHNTELISRHFPAYLFGRRPDESIIATSYAADLAQRNSRDVQRIMDSEVYGRVFPEAQLWSKNVRSVAHGTWLRNADVFEIVGRRGVYRAAGVGGGITGMGGHLILDDYLKNAEEAMSQTILEKQWEWYTSTFRTRLPKGGMIAILATRWSFSDLIGRLLDQAEADPRADQWRVIKLPAINELGPCGDDPRQVGDALWPEFFPADELDKVRAASSRNFEALYQCNPVPLGGNIVKDNWWREYQAADLPQRFEKVIISADLTFKGSTSGDWSVMILMGKHQGRCYILDMVRRQVPFTGQREALRWLYASAAERGWPVREVIVEDAANGAAMVDVLRAEIPCVIGVPAGQASKAARAEAVTPIIEAGNVLLPCPTRAAWVQTLRTEWAQFPMARHDDIVDATVIGLTRLFPPRISMAGAMPMGVRKPEIRPLLR